MPGSRSRWCGLVGLLVALALLASVPAAIAPAGGAGVAGSTPARAIAATSTPIAFRSDGIQQRDSLGRVERSRQSLTSASARDTAAIRVDTQRQALANRATAPSPVRAGGASSRAPPLSF